MANMPSSGDAQAIPRNPGMPFRPELFQHIKINKSAVTHKQGIL